MLTQAYLRELLDYDPETGVLRWKVSRRSVRIGTIAGCIHHSGYRCITIDGRFYVAHRLAWTWMTGDPPPDQIDHRDRNKDNNAWDNLREATPSQNRANAKTNSNNVSGLKGVNYFKKYKRWGAYVKKDGKKIWLGSYASPQEAHAAYVTAAQQLHGEFARAQ